MNLSSSTGESEQMFEISQYLLQELSDVGLNISPHIVSVALSSASSAKNTSLFLIMNIYLLGAKAGSPLF